MHVDPGAQAVSVEHLVWSFEGLKLCYGCRLFVSSFDVSPR